MEPRNRRKSKSSFWQQSGSLLAIAGMVTNVAMVAPARAAVLREWTFEPDTRQLTLTLPDGITPRYFLLAEPARIVLELPDTTLGSIPLEEQYTGAVSHIRISELQSGSRVVIELARNTLLDPRHAELTSTDVGDGRTRWVLQPLLQEGDAVSPIAAEPNPQPSARPPELPAETVPIPVDSAPETSETDPVPLPSTPVAGDASPSDSSESDALDSPEAPDSTEAATAPLPPPSETPVESGPPAVTTTPASPELPELPEVAHSATVGAAQALPDASDSLQGVRTDAAALAGVGSEDLSTLPSDQLPIDPLAPVAQSSGAELPSNDGPRASSPQVSVPSLAEVPEAPPAPDLTTPPAAGSVVENPTPPAPDSDSADAAIAASTIEVPALPLPAETWPDSSGSALPPNQVPPPQPDAIATAENTPPPEEVTASPAEVPIEAPTTDGRGASQSTPPTPQPADNELPPPTTTMTGPDSTAHATPPPPLPEAGLPVPTPPASAPPSIASLPTSPPGAAPDEAAVEIPVTQPPFLAGTGETPRIEQPTIPPPPSLPQSDGTIPFGEPLPPQSKALDSAAVAPNVQAASAVPVGTRLVLQYPGTEPLTLEQQEPWYEVLVVAEDVWHPETNGQLLPKGTHVVGRFEGFDDSGRRFVTQAFMEGSDRHPLLAESDWLLGSSQPDGSNLLTNTSIGAVALTVLSGFSGVGLIGGAAMGAATTMAGNPRVVIIQPGQLIEVEVVSDILPFNDAPDITQRLR